MKTKHLIITVTLSTFALTAYGCDTSNKKTKSNDLALLQKVEEPSKSTEPKNNTVKIALLLDTSNSMDGLINQAKAQLWDVVNKFTHAKCGNDTRPELQIALYQYGNDELSYREGYVQQVLNFTSDLDEISEKLFSLTTNGGEEYCGAVIQQSLKQLDWGKNPDNLKMIFIAGNEPFDQGKLNYKDATTNAKEKEVIVNTIFCGDYQQGIQTKWKEGAILSGGDYMAIDHNEKMVHISTPYDDLIIQLNTKLNTTYIGYGNLGRSKKEKQHTQDMNAELLEEVVVVKRAVSKSSRLYNNKSWDLVDASNEADFDIESVEKEHLPNELKAKSNKEIETYLDQKRMERVEIQKEINALNQKREAYIAEKTHEETGELENALFSAIVKQAAKKNYKWE
ncbi:VWA domain-containing protein [Euzebyella marina]|uniref:VWA domain-containing protein n=1 Tax=Euzebyella marina TaxID=1761453 RepID=A0A3G2L315_9FLAO|nr:vWA domain-containing protein [Euzebyella marina]AYN66613.1 VWA domain-containing protein [Euzebyella marina]